MITRLFEAVLTRPDIYATIDHQLIEIRLAPRRLAFHHDSSKGIVGLSELVSESLLNKRFHHTFHMSDSEHYWSGVQ